jgi:hypothetical protein
MLKGECSLFSEQDQGGTTNEMAGCVKIFPFSPQRGAHPFSCSNGTEGLFLEVKRLGHEDKPSPPPTADD